MTDELKDNRHFPSIKGLALAVLLIAGAVGLFGLYRFGAWLTFKTIEGHIERKVAEMVAPGSLRQEVHLDEWRRGRR